MATGTSISRRALLRLAGTVLALGPATVLLARAAAGSTGGPALAPALEAALGSLVYDEYRGNFAQARRLAAAALERARRGAGPTAVADALLGLAIVDLLGGEPATALARFEEAATVSPADPDRLLWARTGALAAFLLQFNTFPDGTSSEGDEVDLRRYGTAEVEQSRMADYLRAQEQAAQKASAQTRLECELVKQLFHAVVLARDFASFGREPRSAGDVNPIAASAAAQAIQTLGAAAEALGDDRVGAYVVLVAADAYRRLGTLQEARALLEVVVQAYQDQADPVGLAAARMLEGDWRAAPLSTPAVLNLALNASANADSGLSWAVEEAELDRSGIDAEQARAAYAQAERAFRQAGAGRGLAALALRDGYLATLEGDYRAAARACQSAGQGFEASGDGLGLWCARVHLALARIGAGELLEDRETARAVGAWGSGSGAFGYAVGLGMLCARVGRHWLLRDGDYERALACHRLAERLHEALGASIHHAQSLVDQGLVFREIGEVDSTVTLMRRAADRYRPVATGSGPLAASAASRLVALLTELFQMHVAARDAEGMERVAAEIEGLDQRLSAPGAGTDTTGVGDAMLAARLAFQGRAVVAQAAVSVPTLRAIEARDRGERAAADRLFAHALRAARGTDPAVSDPDFLEAIVERARKDYPAAEQAFERYLGRLLGGSPQDRLLDLLRQLDPGQAEGETRKQVERGHEQALAFYVTIDAYRAARKHLQALEASGGEDWWSRTGQPWQTLADCGLAYEGLGQHDQAARHYRRAVDLLEGRRERLRRDERRTAIASGVGPQYLYFQAARNAVAAAGAAAAAGQQARAQALHEEAFGYSERGKARGLLDLMAGGAAGAVPDPQVSAGMRAWREASARASTWRGLLAAERARSAAEQARIDYLARRADAEEERLREIEAALASSDPGFREAVDPRAAVLGVRAVADRLPPGSALLQYGFLGDDLLAWAIDRSGLIQTHRARVDARALAEQIRSLHARCEGRGAVEDLAPALAATLLEPLARVVDSHPDLLIVPYGAAHLLPFHALPWKGAPLVAGHTVSYLPSATTLQFLRRGRGDRLPDGLLAVGNPASMAYQPPFGAPPEPQPPLPAAGVEAAHVAGLFPRGRALIGAEATVEAVREALPGYRLLHFATHGHLAEDVPLLSAVLLANGGALTVYDLVGLRLDADLVVLSACRTGQGKATGGDDVLGLTRGLLAAGARSAVVSLWPVDDLATSVLMERFYRELRAGRPAQAALQSAQNHLRGMDRAQVRAASQQLAESARGLVLSRAAPEGGDYAHPYYWAPFVLVG